jgi:hypothetical protein
MKGQMGADGLLKTHSTIISKLLVDAVQEAERPSAPSPHRIGRAARAAQETAGFPRLPFFRFSLLCASPFLLYPFSPSSATIPKRDFPSLALLFLPTSDLLPSLAPLQRVLLLLLDRALSFLPPLPPLYIAQHVERQRVEPPLPPPSRRSSRIHLFVPLLVLRDSIARLTPQSTCTDSLYGVLQEKIMKSSTYGKLSLRSLLPPRCLEDADALSRQAPTTSTSLPPPSSSSSIAFSPSPSVSPSSSTKPVSNPRTAPSPNALSPSPLIMPTAPSQSSTSSRRPLSIKLSVMCRTPLSHWPRRQR